MVTFIGVFRWKWKCNGLQFQPFCVFNYLHPHEILRKEILWAKIPHSNTDFQIRNSYTKGKSNIFEFLKKSKTLHVYLNKLMKVFSDYIRQQWIIEGQLKIFSFFTLKSRKTNKENNAYSKGGCRCIRMIFKKILLINCTIYILFWHATTNNMSAKKMKRRGEEVCVSEKGVW